MSRLPLVIVAALATACSNPSFVDVTPPPPPASLTSASLDGAIALSWTDESYRWDPARFAQYRVWSAPYDLDADLCIPPWRIEGTTAAPEFTVAALTNGAPRCFAVTGESTAGAESVFSPIRFDTPRWDASAVTLIAWQVDPERSGFRFWTDLDGNGLATRPELGRVGPAIPSSDLVLERDGDGRFYLVPERSGVRIAVWGNAPVSWLTEVDVAPVTGYSRDGFEALPGWGYVVEMPGPDGFKRYGALRVVSAGSGGILFDWSYQSDPGNPELLRAGG